MWQYLPILKKYVNTFETHLQDKTIFEYHCFSTYLSIYLLADDLPLIEFKFVTFILV